MSCKLIWDDCKPTAERRETTLEDIEDDLHVEDFKSNTELLNKLAELAGYNSLDEFIKEFELEDSDEFEIFDFFDNYFGDIGDGSPNILYMKTEEGDTFGSPYDCCVDNLDLDSCSEEELIEAVKEGFDLNDDKESYYDQISDSDISEALADYQYEVDDELTVLDYAELVADNLDVDTRRVLDIIKNEDPENIKDDTKMIDVINGLDLDEYMRKENLDKKIISEKLTYDINEFTKDDFFKNFNVSQIKKFISIYDDFIDDNSKITPKAVKDFMMEEGIGLFALDNFDNLRFGTFKQLVMMDDKLVKLCKDLFYIPDDEYSEDFNDFIELTFKKCGEDELYDTLAELKKSYLTESSSAQKRAYKNGGQDTTDLIQGKAIGRIKDPKAREAAIAAKKAGRDDVVKSFTGDRKEDQARLNYEKKSLKMQDKLNEEWFEIPDGAESDGFFGVYRVDDEFQLDEEHPDMLKDFLTFEEAKKFCKNQAFNTQIVYIPFNDPDVYGEDSMYLEYDPYEVIWDNRDDDLKEDFTKSDIALIDSFLESEGIDPVSSIKEKVNCYEDTKKKALEAYKKFKKWDNNPLVRTSSLYNIDVEQLNEWLEEDKAND